MVPSKWEAFRFGMVWQRAFDRIPTTALASVLQRVDLPADFVNAVREMYTEYLFCVCQIAGLAQRFFREKRGFLRVALFHLF